MFVSASGPRLSAMQAAGQPWPNPVSVRGLVDTGASATVVDKAVLSQLGLTPTGMASVHTPSTGTTPHQCLQYDVGLVVPGNQQSDPPLLQATLAVTESDFSMQGIQALIGRDLLRSCILVYNGATGLFSLAF